MFRIIQLLVALAVIFASTASVWNGNGPRPTKMRSATVQNFKETVQIRDVPLRHLKSGEVLVKIQASGCK